MLSWHIRRLKNLSLAVGALLIATTSVSAQFTLVWSDDFDGGILNAANWEYMYGDGSDYGLPGGWGNNEQQYYTDRPENIFVSGGFLHIVAKEESPQYNGYDYTSARIRSANLQEFLYGKMEARLKLPSTTGIWPAFWMLPTNSPYGGWAASGEIDIMESVNIATTIHGTIHHGGPWPANTYNGGTFNDGTDFSQDFHTFAVEWEPDVIRWTIDGNVYHTETSATWYSTNAPENDRAPFDIPFHFLLNVAVGGNFPGPTDGTSQFPQEMVVDWVRVYAFDTTQTSYLGSPHAIPGTIEAENYDNGGSGVAYQDCDATNNGGAYRPSDGVDMEVCSEGGFNVGWMCANEWLEYTVDVATTGPYLIEARVASDVTGGSFHIEFNGIDATGNVSFPATGGWQNWTTVAKGAHLTQGEQVMRFVNSASADEFNLNYFSITPLPRADLNLDGVVDLIDFGLFVNCLAGPGKNAPPQCNANQFWQSDFDGDADVDLADFPGFQHAEISR